MIQNCTYCSNIVVDACLEVGGTFCKNSITAPQPSLQLLTLIHDIPTT